MHIHPGVSSHVHLILYSDDKDKLVEPVKTHMAFQPEGEAVLYVYDAKALTDGQTQQYPGRPWFLLPPMDFPHLSTCVQAGMELFGPSDIFACFDARRPDIGKKFRKQITSHSSKLVKDSSMQKRMFRPDLRLLYSNEEFIAGYAKSVRMKSLGYLPEPVESITCATGASVRLTSRPRRFVDLPGLTFTRSLSGCLMRSAEEHGVRLSKEAAEKLYSQIDSNQGSEPDDEDREDGNADDDGNKDTQENPEVATAGEDETSAFNPDEGAIWYPWSSSEDTMLEFLNIFAGQHQRVVSWCAGFGQLELACLRSDMTVLSLCQSVTHRQAWELQGV